MLPLCSLATFCRANQPYWLLTNDVLPGPHPSWRFLAETAGLIAQLCPDFWLSSTSRCAPVFKRMCLRALPFLPLVACSIGQVRSDWSWIWIESDRQFINEHCRKRTRCLLLIASSSLCARRLSRLQARRSGPYPNGDSPGTTQQFLGTCGGPGVVRSMESRAAFVHDPTHQVVLYDTPTHAPWMNHVDI